MNVSDENSQVSNENSEDDLPHKSSISMNVSNENCQPSSNVLPNKNLISVNIIERGASPTLEVNEELDLKGS